MRNSQSGFTALEVILVIFLISALAGVGSYSAARITEKNKQREHANIAEISDNKELKDEIKSTNYVFAAAGDVFKLTIPDGWKFYYVEPNQDNEYTHYLDVSVGNMKFQPGVEGSVEPMTARAGVESGLTLKAAKILGGVDSSKDMVNLAGFKTGEGKDVKAFLSKNPKESFESPEDNTANNGYEEYVYYIDGLSYSYLFTYTKALEDPDLKNEVEDFIKTIVVS